MRKSKLAAALVTAIFLANSAASAADIPDEQFLAINPPTNDRYTGINLAVGENDKNTMSSLEAYTADGVTRDSLETSKTTCKKIGDPGCEPNKFFKYNSQLSICNSITITDCVSSVFIKDSSGNNVEGKFVENYPGETKFSYKGEPSLNLPPGDSSFIVDFPTLPHKGGTQYLVIASLLGYRGFNETKFILEDFATAIYAVSKVSGNYSMAQPEDKIQIGATLNGRAWKAGGWTNEGSSNKRASCVQSAGTSCLISWPLSLSTEFGITLKLHTQITGWLHGRLTDARAEITKASDGDQLVTIAGKPSIVPGIFAWFKKSELPAPLLIQYANDNRVNSNGNGYASNSGVGDGPDGLPYSILKTAFGYDEGGMREVRAWLDSVGDKAAYAPTVWTVRNIRSGTQFEKCMKGQESLSGIVSTNSTMYIGAPPTFNQAEQTLDYKVTSPHFLPDGSVFKGMYNLVIKSDVARCIYGFTDAPVAATISIISSDGTSQIATTLFGERNGWMYLSANNFTFSAPTLKVKLTQEVVKPAPTVTPTPSPSASAAPIAMTKKTTITCVKGNTSKKVTAVSPKCPTGYKKK